VLARALTGESFAELRAFYERLLKAEARHYGTFVELAVTAAGDASAEVEPRLRELAALEGVIVTRLAREESRGGISAAPPARATVHG
jgi:tRNA isopentenyl-2-thiomethyl-A-37 hydroxylase MiaE